MHTIDRTALDEAIGTAFKELKTGLDTHSQKSVEMYSLALRALVELRRHLVTEDRTTG